MWPPESLKTCWDQWLYATPTSHTANRWWSAWSGSPGKASATRLVCATWPRAYATTTGRRAAFSYPVRRVLVHCSQLRACLRVLENDEAPPHDRGGASCEEEIALQISPPHSLTVDHHEAPILL